MTVYPPWFSSVAVPSCSTYRVDLRSRLESHTIPFLCGLWGCSPSEAMCRSATFQTFTDAKTTATSRQGLAHLFHGPICLYLKKLERLNMAGAGIYLTPNDTDGRGRKKLNMCKICTKWADLDLKDASEAPTLSGLRLSPTMVVRTPGGYHLYWVMLKPLVLGGVEDRINHENELKAIANALRPFGGDVRVTDISRVLRLPGFYHCKQEPRLVELIQADGPRYTPDEVRSAFPSEPARGRCVAPVGRLIEFGEAQLHRRICRYIDAFPPAIQGANGSGTTFRMALALVKGFGLEPEAASLLMESHYNPRCVPPWSSPEIAKKVRDAASSTTAPGWLLNAGRGR